MLPQGLQDCPRGSPMRVEVAWSPPNTPADAATDAQAPPKSLKRCGVAARSQTRLLTRHLEEVWFPSHACHALLSSLFTSLFAGKREVGPKLKGKGLGTHQMVAHSAASQRFGRLVLQSRRNGAQKMHPKGQKLRYPWAFRIAVPRPRGKPRGT